MRLTNKQLAAFCHDMTMMVGTGISNEEAFEILSHNSDDEQYRELMDSMALSLINGGAMIETMENTGVFPPYLLESLHLAQYSGRYEESFAELADYYLRKEQIEQAVKSTLTRPLFFFMVLALIMVFMLFSVLPVFEKVYVRLGGYSSIYVTLAYTLAIAVLAIIVISLVLGLVIYINRHNEWAKQFIKEISESSLLTANASLTLARYQFMAMLNTRLAGGGDNAMSTKEIEKYVTHTTLKDSVKKAAGRLMDGDELGVVFEEEKILPSAYAHTLFIAGRNGDSLAAIGMITKRLNEDCANELENIISKVEPMITAAFIVSIGVSLISVMLPLIGVITSIG